MLLFSESGNEYRIAEVPEGERLVWRQVLDEEGETYDGELYIISESALHKSPPRQKINNQIAELRATRDDLTKQVQSFRQELKSFEDGTNERMAKLKQHKSLQRLDDYLNGRITHYVELTTYSPPEIIAFEEAKTNDARSRRDKLKLLTLFGRTNGDLEWGLNRYSDGSGINTTVTPCTSYNDAVKAIKELFTVHENKAIDSNDRTAPNQKWVTRAEEYGIEMSPEYLQQLKERTAAAKQAEITKLESQLQKLRGEKEESRN